MDNKKPALLQKFWRKWVSNPEARSGVNLTREVDFFRQFFGTEDDASGESVTVTKGSKIDIAFSCMNALSQDIAKLPFNIRRDTAGGKVIEKDHPAYNLIHNRPNPYTSSFNFWYRIIFDMLSWGNGYAFIKRDKYLAQEQLLILDPWEVDAIVVEGEVFYKYKNILLEHNDVLHFKIYSIDGIIGISPILHNAKAFGARLKQEKYTAKVLGEKPPGILTFKQELNAEQRQENRDMWKRMTQGEELGGTPVLSGGASYTPLMVNPTDGQMIEASNLSDQRICGIYRVPPTIVQSYERATFSNAEQQDLVYLKYSLTPIITVLEQECNYKLFTEREKMSKDRPYVKVNIKAMLRGDLQTQKDWYQFLRHSGLASANTILEMEDLPRLEGEIGDMVLVQGAMVPLDQLKGFYEGKTAQPEAARMQLGFDIEQLKRHIERYEILNNHEEGLHQ